MEIKKSSVVRSAAGRDKGRCFLVVDTFGDDYALIADGDLRKIEKPKKKKKKHLKNLNISLDIFERKLYNCEKIYDKELKKALEQFSI